MATPSKIDRLPGELREMIGRLRRNGCTIREIFDKLRELDADVGRSGLGEYIKKFDAVAARIHQSRAAADAIMAKLDKEGAEDRVARFNVASLHASIMQLMAGEDGEDVTLDPKECKMLADAMKNLASAAKIDIERIQKIEARAAAKAKKEAAETAAVAMIERGISMDTVEAIKSRVLGVQRPAALPPPTPDAGE